MANFAPFKRMVMQPTSLCNINCSYCYLANRDKNLQMPIGVAQAVAAYISENGRPMRIIWHGGEPLACGIEHFSRLLEPFEDLQHKGLVKHSLQTNATLITESWCAFFRKNDIAVGVSIDGPAWANINRVNWSGKAMVRKILAGISQLKEHAIPFTAIAVITEISLDRPEELYGFFCDLGCVEVGFNIEEQEGIHKSSAPDDEERVVGFWKRMYAAWQRDPRIAVREIERTLLWIANPGNPYRDVPITDLFPSIAHDGKVVFLSPELLDARSEGYRDFEAGNVLVEPLESIVRTAHELGYIRDFTRGVGACRTSCEYFDFCRGGQAGNKFFELGSTAGTETTFCRNSEQRLLRGVLAVL